MEPVLFQGEQVVEISGILGMYKYFPSDEDRPLIVLVPGGRSTARLYYGVHSGYKKHDFLTYWLRQKGHPVLAISHPVETKKKIFEKNYPQFSVKEWGQLIGSITKKIMQTHQLSNDFYLVGWSAGGKSVLPSSLYAQENNINLKGFIALAATPPILGLIPYYWDNNEMRESGYWNTANSFPRETIQIIENFKLSDSSITKETLLDYYLGHNPISILGTGWRYSSTGFKADIEADIEDNINYRYDLYPLSASIAPTEPDDIGHSLTDKYVWSMVFSQSIYKRYFKSKAYTRKDFTDDQWKRLMNFMDRVPPTLHRKIQNGNHCFFTGRIGAKKTAEHIVDLIQLLQNTERELHKILNTDISQ